MSRIVAIDAGTTGVRALLLDSSGSVIDLKYREFPQHFPKPGWVEHDLDEIWAAIKTVLSELTEDNDGPFTAIGITNQRETAAAWDKESGAALGRAIVWQDRRTANKCEDLTRQGALPLVRDKTGLVLDPYFSATKFAWMLEHGVAASPELALGTIDSWLVHKLTGGAAHITEPSNASRTMLFDIDTLDWSSELCELFEVPIEALPVVMPSSGRFGVTAETTALGAGIPISGIAGDQQAALFGQACLEPGMTKNTYGTGSFVLMNTGPERPPTIDGLLTTVAWQLDHETVAYAYEGAIFATGAGIQWLRDGLGIIDDSSETAALAESVTSTDDVFVVPAFAGLGSPWWDPHARGTIVGITRGTTKAHIVRATVEAMAYQTRDVVSAMSENAGIDISELRVDGGASVMDLLLQIQADQLNVTVRRPENTETTVLGAAYLAGLAEGVWESPTDVERSWQSAKGFTPNRDEDVDAKYQRWLQAVERARSWAIADEDE